MLATGRGEAKTGSYVALGGSTLGAVTTSMLVEAGNDDGNTRTVTCVRYHHMTVTPLAWNVRMTESKRT